MKLNRLFVIASLLLSTEVWALNFKVGSSVSEKISEDELMTALRQGKDKVKGVKIVVKSGANVPADMKQKWMANQLSGASAPSEGTESPDVVFVEGF